ncbi:unnamed protein product [Aphanomyces euteiches]
MDASSFESAQFESTAAFDEAFESYQKSTNQDFVLLSAKLASKVNDRKANTSNWTPIPTDAIKYISAKFCCKFGATKGRNGRWAPQKTDGCKAFISVRAVFLPTETSWVLKVDKVDRSHDHTTVSNTRPLPVPKATLSKDMTPAQFRSLCRSGKFESNSAGYCPGFAQANLVILPRAQAFDFLLFCQRNKKPCPLLEVSDPGCVEMLRVAPGSDIRTDLPKYRIYNDGILTKEVTDITKYWRDDLVTFLLGCSFSFEEALQSAGLAIRHQEEGKNVPMYRTNIPCDSAGVFSGNMVVSMRPFKPADAITASVITARYPNVHGSPVHVGSPKDIGIKDIGKPDYGDAVTIRRGEVPVFWACGVTPQNVLLASKPAFAITHAPGHMFMTDRLNDTL